MVWMIQLLVGRGGHSPFAIFPTGCVQAIGLGVGAYFDRVLQMPSP